MDSIQIKTVTTSKILGLCTCKQKTGTLYTSSYWFAVKFHKNFDMNIFLDPKLKVLKFIHYIEYRNHVISPSLTGVFIKILNFNIYWMRIYLVNFK